MRPIKALIHLEHLRHNYRIIQQHVNDANIMAVVKANAYGHGLSIIAPVLYEQGCRYFAVSDATEGVELRHIMAERTCEIILLSGIFEPSDAELATQHQLTPVVTESHHIEWLQQAAFNGSVWLKVDTGMQRFGAGDSQALYQQIKQTHIGIAGIMSHLACSDMPEHPLNRAQADAFAHIRAEIQAIHHDKLPASLLNSAGLIALPDQSLQMVRPGLALYGAEPVAKEPFGLLPVMELSAQIMQVRHIKQGTPVSYGASFTAPQDMQIALVCAGYADGVPRQLSNRGMVSHGNHLYPIIGRVCMDYCLIDCSNQPLQCGQYVSFWGNDALRAEHVAQQVDSIAYTLMTAVSARVPRVPV